jgi:hypothetical protein
MLSPSDFARSMNMNEQQYHFLSQSLNDLERQVERHRSEQYLIFDRLIEAGLMEPRIKPRIADFRQQKTQRYRFHPYTGTTSTSSDRPYSSSQLNPVSDPSHFSNQLRLYNPLSLGDDNTDTEIRRHRRSLNSLPPTDKEPGTEGNPIYVLDDDDLPNRCEGCDETGHFILDCTKEYRFDEQIGRFVPILGEENLTEYRYIVNTQQPTHGRKDESGHTYFPQ